MNYDELSARGIIVLDIPATDVPKVFLERIIRQTGSNFHTFFNDFVINANKEFLAKTIPVEHYKEDYARLLNLNPDGRNIRALQKEVAILNSCHAKAVSYTPFASVGFKSRPSAKPDSPIRVSMHVSDKLDLRAGANLHQLPLADYIAVLITTGMLRIFIRHATTPEEQALLEGRADANEVAESHLIDALDSVYDRIIHEYKAALGATGGTVRDTSNYAAYSLRGLVRREIYPDLSGVQPVAIPYECIREPKPDSPDSVLIPVVQQVAFSGLLNRNQVQAILESNNQRALERIADTDAPIADPAIKETVDRFRATVFRQTMTKESKVNDIWVQFRSILVAQIDSLARVYGKEIDAKDVAASVERELFAVLVSRGVVEPEAECVLEMSHELVSKVRIAIESANANGGITKSHLRRVIGRSHPRYVAVIDEILAYLLETGKYRLESGRYLVSTGNPVMDRSPRRVQMGRPKRAIQGEIVRVVDGRIDVPPAPKAVKIPKSAEKFVEED